MLAPAQIDAHAVASPGAQAALGRETALAALDGGRLWGEPERDDGGASVNPDLFVMPVISIRKVVVESCRGSSGRRLKHGRMLR
jgi:hypothetical protein